MACSHGKVGGATTCWAILAVLLAMSVIVSVAKAQEDFKVMKVKELKAFLQKRGADCLACSSKEDYVERAMEIKEWPEVEQKEEKAPESGGENVEDLFKDDNLNDEERMKKLKEMLEKEGVDTSNLFINGKLNAEELAKQFQDQKDPEMHDATDASAEKTEANAEKAETKAGEGAEAEAEAKTEL